MSKKKEHKNSKAETVAEKEITPEAEAEEVEGADEGEVVVSDQAADELEGVEVADEGEVVVSDQAADEVEEEVVEEVEEAAKCGKCDLARELILGLTTEFVIGNYREFSSKGIEQQVLPKLERIIRTLS